ncbi:NmrA/HSCARG family protein [Pseudomonas chlororaphis]|uniref:NmrA/HSCARG family protein n=1 Tax=Pseudomonas chlororaphis TaxID=587753 RepID=UPI0030D61FF0
MAIKRSVLVTGATGQQGGAVAYALLARGHRVKALTRNLHSDAARQLASAGAELVVGDFSDRASLIAAAKDADTLFLMGSSKGVGSEEETRQGIAAVDAAKAAGIGHLVYTSVANGNTNTGIAHFDSKYRVEQHIASSGIPYTVSAPVSFMENCIAPWAIEELRHGVNSFLLPPNRSQQMVALADIAAFVVTLIERRERVFGKRFDIAGDELSGEERARILTQAIGRPIIYQAFPATVAREKFGEGISGMTAWYDNVGYKVDILALRRDFSEIRWHSYADWAREFDWSVLDKV